MFFWISVHDANGSTTQTVCDQDLCQLFRDRFGVADHETLEGVEFKDATVSCVVSRKEPDTTTTANDLTRITPRDTVGR